MTQPNQAFLNGVPELLVLRLLREREMYGYELVQAIRDATSNTVVFAEGVIYPLLHALERDGALSARRQTVAGRNRVYYRVTPSGTERLSQLTATWQRLNQAITSVLGEPRHA
jgi:PadR family transcriptional regulator, regulatory protein PadR